MTTTRVLTLLAMAAAATACTGRDGGNDGAPKGAANSTSANATGTSEGPEETGARAGLNGQELRLASEGLATSSPGLHSSGMVEFGQPRDQVVAAVAAIRGQPTATGRNEECPSGPVDYASFGTLDLHFEDGKFAGWLLDAAATPPIEQEYGLTIGWTRRDLMESDHGPATFENGSLGPEFQFGGIGGLLDGAGPDAKVTTLFSGVTCFAR